MSCLERFSTECRKTKNQSKNSDNQNKEKYHKEPMRTQRKRMHVNGGLKRGKTRVIKSRLALVLHLIGSKWRDVSQTNHRAKNKNKTKLMQCRITFDTLLKIALSCNSNFATIATFLKENTKLRFFLQFRV